jgi:hypothetical protein
LPSFCSHLLPENLKIKIYKIVILPIVLYECGTWSLTVRKEHSFRVFEKRVLRKIFEPKRRTWQGAGEACVVRRFIIYMLH